MGLDISLRECLALSLVGVYYNQILPSSFGGDLVKLFRMGKTRDKKKVGYSILIDRLSTLVVLFLHLILAYGFFKMSHDFMLASIVLFAIIGGLLLWVFKKDSIIEGYVLMLLSYISLIFILFSFYLILCSLNYGSDIKIFTFDFPVSMLISALPVSISGWGVREWYLSSLEYGNTGAIVSASVIFGLLNVITGLPGLFLDFKSGVAK